jgi:hypothetical protein
VNATSNTFTICLTGKAASSLKVAWHVFGSRATVRGPRIFGGCVEPVPVSTVARSRASTSYGARPRPPACPAAGCMSPR